MVVETKQLRLTIPKWIVDLKGWKSDMHLEVVPLVRDDNNPITKDSIFIIKEVKHNGK